MPVTENKLLLLGKIIKAHGYEGALMIVLEKHLSEEFQKMETVFIEVDGKPVPFFISWSRETAKDSVLVKFDDLDSREMAIEFVGSRVFTESDQSSNKILPQHLILTGYTFRTSDDSFSGNIEKVLDLPMQYLLIVKGERGDEKMIPFNEQWIEILDHKRKLLTMTLPDGILDINP